MTAATRIGVLKESAPGERRVAMPETVSRLRSSGHEVMVECGAGAGSGVPDSAYAESGAVLAQAAEIDARAGLLLCVEAPDPARVAGLHCGQTLAGMLRPDAAPDRDLRCPRVDRGQPPAAPAYAQPCPGTGRADLAGQHRGLPRRAPRGGDLRTLLPHAHHRGRNLPAGPRTRPRRGSGRAVRDRHRAAPRRSGHGIRRPAAGGGRGEVDGCAVPRPRSRRGRPGSGRAGRLCACPQRTRTERATGGAAAARPGIRHRHHHRAGAGTQTAPPGHPRRPQGDASRLDRGRSGRRSARRQRRGLGARAHRRARRRDHRDRRGRSRLLDGRRGVGRLRPQHCRPGRRAGAGRCTRDRPR